MPADSVSVSDLGKSLPLDSVSVREQPEKGHIGLIGGIKIQSAQWAITLTMLGILAMTTIGVFILYGNHKALALDVRDIHDLATTFLTSEVALLGSIIGFYFGERRGSS